jgi:hypothetical protein
MEKVTAKIKTTLKERHMRNYLLGTILLGCVALSSIASSQTISDFDRNKDNKLDAEELRAFLVHKFLSAGDFGKIDANKDGLIDSTERETFVRKYLIELQSRFHMPPPYTLDQIASSYPLQKDLDLLGVLGIRIRDSYEQNTLDEIEKTFKNAKPALLTFTRNIESNQNSFIAKGAIMRPIRIYSAESASPSNEMYLSTIVFTPSLTINRTVSPDKTKETDSQQWRMGADVETAAGWIALQNFRVFAAYATDFEWKSKVVGAEFQWEPTFDTYGSGSYWRLIDPVLDIRWRLYPHFEYGYVVDAGEKTNIKTGDTYFRLGPKATLDVYPVFAPGFVLSIQYAYLAGITGTPRVSRMFDPALSYQIDSQGHIVLQVEYSFGQVPLTEENVESLTVGVGIKF